MNRREEFEAAWAKEYPLHSRTAFMRSGFDAERYVNTRVQDGWLMWSAALDVAPTQGADARPVAITDEVLYKLWALALDSTEHEFKASAPALLTARDAAPRDSNRARGAMLSQHEIAYALHVASGRTKSIVACHAIVNAALATRDAAPSDGMKPREVKRDSDFSVTVVFSSCRLASEFERQMIAASAPREET